jgi:hypothetical protein
LVFREVDVVEVKEMLRLWVRGHGFKSMVRLTQIDRKTVRRYVEAAVSAGMRQAGGEAQITDGLTAGYFGCRGQGSVVGAPDCACSNYGDERVVHRGCCPLDRKP